MDNITEADIGTELRQHDETEIAEKQNEQQPEIENLKPEEYKELTPSIVEPKSFQNKYFNSLIDFLKINNYYMTFGHFIFHNGLN